MDILKAINLVEGFKYIGKLVASKDGSPEIHLKYSRNAVDIFIIIKWLFVFCILIVDLNKTWITIIVWYLLFSNLFTYFYYHTWDSKTLTDVKFSVNRIKRRYFTLIQAISFSLFGFSYLYFIPYASEFKWDYGNPKFIQSLWFSITNSLTANFEQVKPVSDLGNSIAIIQLVMMFVFLSIIIGGSVPQIINSLRREG
ncbi:MAG: hypothetical protein ACTSQ8_19905 [Candidatus Helarchaeota archaeon]